MKQFPTHLKYGDNTSTFNKIRIRRKTKFNQTICETPNTFENKMLAVTICYRIY